MEKTKYHHSFYSPPYGNISFQNNRTMSSSSAIYNGIYIHNPNNIEAQRINYHLLNDFKGLFDISYNTHKTTWISSDLKIEESDRIELLTVHSYDTLISERHEDRSMKGVRIVNIQQKNLH